MRNICCLLLVLAAFTNGYAQSADELYKKGLESLKNEKYKAAAKQFTKAIKEKASKEYYKARGDAYLGMEEWGDAMDDFNKAIELDAKYGEAYTGRGKAKFGMGDRDKGCMDYVQGRQLGDHKAFDLIKTDCK